MHFTDYSSAPHVTLASPADTASFPAGTGAVVFYRTPYSPDFRRLVQSGTPRSFTSLNDLPLTGGYAIMPFGVTAACPLVFIEPDSIEQLPLPEPSSSAQSRILTTDETIQRTVYHQAFTAAHNRLETGELQKIVLSRRLNVSLSASHDTEEHPERLWAQGYEYFVQACHNRPNSYVAFWWTPLTGAWLVATPEPLLEQDGTAWRTVALAGTMPWTGQDADNWNEKNREEQAIVRRFITSQLEGLANGLDISPTHTLHTGNIQHLCTDFRFGIDSPDDLRRLLLRLHPTPAVCGLPREASRQAILHDETTSRHYYAGFSGPLELQGETHLYVSLRCMQFTASQATLYAGGGLMPESDETEEWEETQRKMLTMWQLL